MKKKILVTTRCAWKTYGRFGLHFLTDFFIKRDFDILWLTVPFSIISLIKPTFLKEKYKKLRIVFKKGNIYKKDRSQIINIMALSVFHPVGSLPFLNNEYVAKNYLKISFPSIKSLLRKYYFENPDILMFDVGGVNGDIFQFVNPKFTIYRLNDAIRGFPNMPKGRVMLEREFLKKVDLVFAVSEELYNYSLKIRGRKGVYLLPNGVEIDKFSKEFKEPPEYKKIPTPRAIYVGALKGWFDWDLITSVAKINRDTSFVMIGKGEPPNNLPRNVFVLGPIPHRRIPALMQYADVGLIPLRNLPIIENMEKPLKFYEYLASGLPTVSVDYGKLKKGMSPYAIFGNTPKEFNNGIKKALNYSKEEKEELKKIAEQFSWKRIYVEFEKILNNYGIVI